MAQDQRGYVQKTQVTRRPYFIGFNTVGQSRPPYTLTNIELIKRDLSNHFATPLGSRVMLPNYGTQIYDMLFDPFDEITKNAIIEDAVRVVSEEPRVSLVKIDVQQTSDALNIGIILLFKPESITDNMFVAFSLVNKESF